MTKKIWQALTLSTLLFLVVDGRPNCQTYGGKDVVCTAGNEDYVLRRGLVSDNSFTTGITLRDCRIIDVEYEAFQNLLELKYIDLSINRIQNLKLGVFDRTTQVTYINLSYNSITEFPLGLFDQKPNLEVLDLKGNKLHTIKAGLFDPFKKLRYLDLSSNNILGKGLSSALFAHTTQITFMDFSRNDMRNSPEDLLYAFKALTFLNLDRCSLTDVPSFATISNLKTMQHLLLSTNQISRLDESRMFIHLESLEIINFVANVIEYINEDVFKPLRNLRMVKMSYNKLKTIPDTLFQNLNSLGNVDLSHNSLVNIPTNAFRGTVLRNLNLAVNRLTYLQDNFCLELKNSGARLTKFYFNQNPWQCACLKDILNEVKSFEVEYNDVKYDGRQPVCVTTTDFTCKRHQSSNVLYSEMYDNINLV